MSILEVTQTVTLEEEFEKLLIMSERTGELKRYTKRLLRAEITGSVLGVTIGYVLCFLFRKDLSTVVFYCFIIILTAVFCIDVLFNVIYRNKNAVKKLKKNYTRRYKENPAYLKLLWTHTNKVIITDEYLEADTSGVLTRVYHKDFIGSFETGLFYVLEYAHFHYVFIKKDAVLSDEYRRAAQLIAKEAKVSL